MLMYEDENHIIKTALQFYSIYCKKNGHPRLAVKSDEMANKIKCDETTSCNHNIETTER